MSYASDAGVRALAQAFGADVRQLSDGVQGASLAAGEALAAATTTVADLSSLLASDRSFPIGTSIWLRAEGYGVEVVASGGDLVTAGGMQLRRVVRPNDHYALTGQTYMPEITRALVDAGGSLYRHVPAIAVRADGHILGAYLRNQTSGAESADSQRAVFVRSDDKGLTWTPAVEELNEAATATNPLTVAARPLQGEIFVAYDRLADQEIATVAHRGISPGNGYIAFRNAQAGAQWTNYRILFNSAGNPVLSSDSLDGTPPAGLSQRMLVDGTNYEVVTFKPVFDRTGHMLVIPLLLVTAFGVDHRVAFLIRRDGAWSVSAPIPLGDVDIGATWEPTTWQADDGTWYCQGRNNNGLGGASYDNHVIASSPDLQSWSPFVYLDADVHVNRIIKARASDRLWMGVGTTHPINRNALSLWLSIDGHQWSHGRTISDEVDGAAWAQYSDIDFHDGEAYVLYTASEPTTATAPNTVRFARFPLPSGVPISGSDANHYLLDGGEKPSVRSGFALVIPPRMRGAVAGCGRPHVLTLRCRVTAAPGPVPYVLAAVGNSRWGYLTVEYRQGAGGTELFSGGVKIADVASPMSWTTIQINIDPLAGHATAFGQTRATGRFASVYLGDVSPGGTDQTGNIEYDGGRSGLIIYPNGLPRLLRPEAPPIVGSSVTAQDDGNASLIVDAGLQRQAAVRYLVDGVERASSFYDNSGNLFREIVGGTSIRRVQNNQQEMQSPVTMLSMLRAPTTNLTPASGAVSVSRLAHAIAAGEVSTINGGADGDILILRAQTTGENVTIKHGTGNIYCGGSDKVLSSIQHRIMLHRAGTNWHMISASLS